MKFKVGDKVICLVTPFGWETNLKVGEIYEIAEASDHVYSNSEAVQVAGGCYGSWFLVKRFELLTKEPEPVSEPVIIRINKVRRLIRMEACNE